MNVRYAHLTIELPANAGAAAQSTNLRFSQAFLWAAQEGISVSKSWAGVAVNAPGLPGSFFQRIKRRCSSGLLISVKACGNSIVTYYPLKGDVVKVKSANNLLPF